MKQISKRRINQNGWMIVGWIDEWSAVQKNLALSQVLKVIYLTEVEELDSKKIFNSSYIKYTSTFFSLQFLKTRVFVL